MFAYVASIYISDHPVTYKSIFFYEKVMNHILNNHQDKQITNVTTIGLVSTPTVFTSVTN